MPALRASISFRARSTASRPRLLNAAPSALLRSETTEGSARSESPPLNTHGRRPLANSPFLLPVRVSNQILRICKRGQGKRLSMWLPLVPAILVRPIRLIFEPLHPVNPDHGFVIHGEVNFPLGYPGPAAGFFQYFTHCRLPGILARFDVPFGKTQSSRFPLA